MNPRDAVIVRAQILEGQLRLLRDPAVSRDANVNAMAAAERVMLANAALYTWRQDLLRAAIVASASLPEISFSVDLAPTPSGLYLFAEPVNFEGMPLPIQGIGWQNLGDGDDLVAVWLYARDVPRTFPGLAGCSASIIARGSDPRVAPRAAVDIRTDPVEGSSFSHLYVSTISFLVSSWLWLKQSVMRTTPVQVAGAAKKIASRVEIQPIANVITLRRAESSERVDGEHSDIEWSCQWLVRGHWRKQFLPSTGRHEPRWIEPYVKGPDDKPFRPPQDTIFAVNR